MDLGYFTVGAPGGHDFVGDARARGIGQRLGMGFIRVVMGILADDESRARRAATIFAWMACPSGFLRKPFALETRRRNGRRYHAVLRALDDSQLHRFSSICSIAFKPAFRTVARD